MSSTNSQSNIDRKQIENELKDLLSKKSSAWQKIGVLLATFRDNKLFQPEFADFSPWLNWFASSIGYDPSNLWRWLGVATYVADKRGGMFDDLEKVQVSPSKIEVIRKIAKHDEPLADALYERVEKGDPKVTMKFLGSQWDTLQAKKSPHELRQDEIRVEIPKFLADYSRLSPKDQEAFLSFVFESIAFSGDTEILPRARLNFNAR